MCIPSALQHGFTIFNGGPYRDFISKYNLSYQELRNAGEGYIIKLLLNVLKFDGFRMLNPNTDTYDNIRRTLIYVLEQTTPSLEMLMKDPAFTAGNTAIFVVSTKKPQIIFPHKNMDVFEVCVRDEITPDEIVEVFVSGKFPLPIQHPGEEINRV